MHFLSMWLSGIIAIVMVTANLTGRYLQGFWRQLNIFLQLSVPLQFFLVSSKTFMTLSDILYILWKMIINTSPRRTKKETKKISYGVDWREKGMRYDLHRSPLPLVPLLFLWLIIIIGVFHIRLSWWSFTGVWVTASRLKSPGLFSVFWRFSIMLSFGWSPLVRQLPSPPVPSIILRWLPKAPITIAIIISFMFYSFFNSLARSRYLSFFSYSFSFIMWSTGTAKSTILQILFFIIDYYKVWSSGRD